MALTDFASDLGQLVARQKPGTVMTPEMKALYAQRKWQNMHYAEYFWYIVLAVIGILAVVNAMDKGYNSWRKYRTLRQRLYDNQLPHGELRPVRNGEGGVRASRIPLAIGNWLRIACYRWTFPFTDATLADAFINLAYIALMLLWSFVASRNCNMKLWASRTGAIASSQVPLLPVLAAKNNIITLVTGISHEKMYALHRAAGRIMLLGIWLHSVGKVLSGSNFEAMHAKAALVGLICFTLTFILSLGPIRKFWYEWFLASHCILIAGYFIGGWYHAAHFEKGYWFWSAMVLWALDRVLRVARTIWIARPGNKMVTREATIELISEDTVAMRMVRPVSWKAGAHAFIIVPSISGNPLEAHPFTISTIPNPPTREATESSSQHEMTFIIRGRKGFTGRLRNQAAMARQTGRNVVNAYIDGPYGVPPDLTTFSTCVLIAGGSGVSYTIAMLEELIQKARKGTSACQRIVFIWSIRDEAHIAWIYGQLLAALACVPPELSVSIRIFVTRAPGFLGRLPFENGMQRQPSMDSEKYTGKEKTSLTAYPEVRIEYGRPNIEQLAFEEACMARGAMSIDASGPAPLIHSVRAASRSSRIAGAGAIARGMPSITLHVEMFSM